MSEHVASIVRCIKQSEELLDEEFDRHREQRRQILSQLDSLKATFQYLTRKPYTAKEGKKYDS